MGNFQEVPSLGAEFRTLEDRLRRMEVEGRGAFVGQIVMLGMSATPPGWLLCDGAAVSRTTYAALFARIGTTYGAGNGSTTFNLPNLRDRFPVGAGSGYAAGATGGAASVALTVAQMPAHNHGGATTGATFTDAGVYSGGGSTNFKVQTWDSNYIGANGTWWSHLAHTHGIASQGDGAAHENRPPYLGVFFAIRAL